MSRIRRSPGSLSEVHIRSDPAGAAAGLQGRIDDPARSQSSGSVASITVNRAGGGSMIIPFGLVIYEPKGAAREYAARPDQSGSVAGEAAVAMQIGGSVE